MIICADANSFKLFCVIPIDFPLAGDRVAYDNTSISDSSAAISVGIETAAPYLM